MAAAAAALHDLGDNIETSRRLGKILTVPMLDNTSNVRSILYDSLQLILMQVYTLLAPVLTGKLQNVAHDEQKSRH